MNKITSFKWFVTIFPDTHPWTFPEKLPKGVKYMKGQLEECPTTSRKHYHVVMYLTTKQAFTWVQTNVFDGHKVNCQVIRNDTAADRYVEKDASRIAGPWVLGKEPDRRSNITGFLSREPATPIPSEQIQKYMQYQKTDPTLSSDWSLVEPEVNEALMARMMKNYIV